MKLRVFGAIAAFLVSAAAPLQAEQYQAATFLPPSHLLTVGPMSEWSHRVKAATDGRIEFKVHTGGALLGPKSMVSGLADNVAQVGFVAASYYPKAFPKTNAIDDLSFIHTDPMALAFGFTDFVMSSPEIHKEWERNGLVFIAGMSTPPYQLFCRSEIETAEDLKGKKIRTPGAVLTRWSEFAGASPVNVPFSEAYIGLERGALDCVAADKTTLTAARLMEVTEHVITLDLGAYFLGSPWTLSQSFWQSISTEERKILLDETMRGLAKLQITYAKDLAKSVKAAKEHGVTFEETPESLKKVKEAFVEEDMGGSTEIIRKELGVEDPGRFRDQLTASVEKWEELLATVGRTNEAELVSLLRQEIYESVDPARYGL